MAGVNRSELIELLDRLGADHDDMALVAARALHSKVSEAGLTWGGLLRNESDSAFGATAATEESHDLAAGADGGTGVTAPGSAPPDVAEAARLIDRLLARKTISETLRAELGEFKSNIAKGEFDAMDRAYIAALAKRLGAGP